MNSAQDKAWESEAETTTYMKYNNLEDLCIELVNCNLQVPCELVPLMTKVIPLIKAKEYQTIFLPKRSNFYEYESLPRCGTQQKSTNCGH